MYGEDLDWRIVFELKVGQFITIRPSRDAHQTAASRSSAKRRWNLPGHGYFYHKYYAAATPFWLHSLIMTAFIYLAVAAIEIWPAELFKRV